MGTRQIRATSTGSRVGVSRVEFDSLSALVDACLRDLDLQFRRMAQMQAELDLLRSGNSGGILRFSDRRKIPR
jgi:hypothetical protein